MKKQTSRDPDFGVSDKALQNYGRRHIKKRIPLKKIPMKETPTAVQSALHHRTVVPPPPLAVPKVGLMDAGSQQPSSQQQSPWAHLRRHRTGILDGGN